MFDKLFRKIDQVKEEVFDQTNKHMNDVGRNIRGGVGEAINNTKSDIFSSILSKVTDTATTGTLYLAQVEKMGNEKRAQELGMTSRELKSLTLEQIAEKYDMTVEQYKEKLAKDAQQTSKRGNLLNSAKDVQQRAETELKAREIQAKLAGMSVEAFDDLTLQEQADKLNITLDDLLDQRALNF